jgi:hypothetical protein
VSTDVPMLTTESGAQEATMEASTIAELPQVGGQNGGGADWQNFIILMPGAAGTPQMSSSASSPGQVASINGNLPYESMLQDGATTTLPMSENSDVTVFETTAEVKVSATGFSAQYGVGDIVYNQITKSGSDKFHGAAYEYFQNNALNAAPYAFGTNTGVPVLRFNNFGGAVGGPILKRRLFFFFDYDRTIDNGGASTKFSTEPTPAMMSGDFTGLPTLYDPTTQILQTTGTCDYIGPQYGAAPLSQAAPCVNRQSFASEYGNGNKIPASMISPVAQALQKLLPASNTAGTPVAGKGYNQNNFVYNTPATNPFIKWFGRLDFDITPSNRLTLSETESDNPGTNVSEKCPFNCYSGDVSRDNAQISDILTVSSHLINEARLGFTDQLNFFVPQTLSKGWPAQLGLQFAETDLFPTVNVSGFDQTLQPGTNAVYKEMLFDPSDVVTLIKGRHVLHFGGEFLINRADSTNWGNINAANVTFGGTYTAQGGNITSAYDGFSYADFLLGQVQQWTAGDTPEYGGRWKTPQMFIQDDVKVKPDLTVNLGVRYEIETGWSETHGNEAVFDPAVSNFNVASTAINGIPAGSPVQGGMWYGFSGANGRTTLQAPKYDIVLPRVGFSWQARNNTVIRGGFGFYASTWSEDTYGVGLGSALGSSGGINDTSTTNGLCPVVNLNSTTTTPNTQDNGNSPGTCGVLPNLNPKTIAQAYVTAPTTPWAQNGNNVSYNEYHTPVPTNYQYTLAVQREFLTDFVGEVAYVGNHGTHLNTGSNILDINQVPESKLGQGPTAEPYPIFGQITGSTNNALSNYNALQASLTKRMSRGLQFDVNYTWSHFLDDMDTSGWGSRAGEQTYQNAYVISQNYGNSNFDIRQMLKGELIYKLPFGRGTQFLNNNLFLDEVAGGWQTAVTFMAQGGNPFSINTGQFNSSGNLSGNSTQWANLVGNYKDVHTLAEWFDPTAFAVPAANTYGTFGRNIIRGPDLTDVNFSAGKTFDLWPERGVKFEIRGDATNILNHPSFGQPGMVGNAGQQIGSGVLPSITSVTISGRAWQIYGRLSF